MRPLMPFRVFNKAKAVLPVEDGHWYSITAAAPEGEADSKVIEVYVYGEIGAWGITAYQFIQDLKAVDDGVSPVVVAFNTNGGDLFEGLAIHNALRRLGERCTGRVDGLAASAGSVAVCGAHRVADFMRRCKGKVMVSINDHPDIRRAFDGFHFECLDIRYSNTNQRQGRAEVTGELVIMNWQPSSLGGLF